MKWMALSLASLLCLAAAPSQAQRLEGENLLMAPPAGFKVGFKDSRNGVTLIEWVPTTETVQSWSEMVTVQVFAKRPDLDPGPFLRKLQDQWLTACSGSAPAAIMNGNENGYASAMMMMRCPLLPSTGKPETTMFRAIKGKDAFYLVQRAVRSAGSPEQVEGLKKYLGQVSVCDAGSREHPCPDLRPHGR